MKIRYDLFLSRQSLVYSPTFINEYEMTDVSETASIWPGRHVQSLESSGPFVSYNSHITPHPSLYRRPFLTLISIVHPPLPPRPPVLRDESGRPKRHDTIVAFLDPGEVISSPSPAASPLPGTSSATCRRRGTGPGGTSTPRALSTRTRPRSRCGTAAPSRMGTVSGTPGSSTPQSPG